MTAVKKFEGWGLTFERPAGDQIKIPADITDISSEHLGLLFSKLTAWTDYIASQLATAQLDERAVDRAKKFMEATMLVNRMGSAAKGERVTAIKAEIMVHPEVIELDTQYEEAYAYRKLVEMLLANHERDMALVSREITRRSSEARFIRKDY